VLANFSTKSFAFCTQVHVHVDRGRPEPEPVSDSCKSPRECIEVIENSPKSLSMRDGTDCVAERPASSSSPGYIR
jgi:hypothetical protein